MPSNSLVTHSGFEGIDTAVYRFVNESLNIHSISNKGYTKVPVIWLGTERVHQIKNDKDLRDKVGKLKLPLMTITRTSVSRDDDFRGSYRSYYPVDREVDGGRVPISKIIKQEKTRNFANADENNRPIKGNETGPSYNRKIVYETTMIPKPTYITCMYEVNIRTEYQQQMNQILPSFIIDQKNVVLIENNGYEYEMFIQSDYGITNNINSLGEDERMFTAKVQFKVLGYLTGDSVNDDAPEIIKKQNVVSITVGRERVVGRNIGNGLRTEFSTTGEEVGLGGERIDPNNEEYHVGSFRPRSIPEEE